MSHWVYNTDDNDFNIGDLVFITNSLLPSEECYSAEVRSVVSNEQSSGLGVHYVLLIVTHIEDYMQIREAKRCFRSVEQYEQLRRGCAEDKLEFKRKCRDARNSSIALIGPGSVWV